MKLLMAVLKSIGLIAGIRTGPTGKGNDMKDRVSKLMEEIANNHVMQSGQVYGWEACGVSGKDTCKICGLVHRWGRNGQNSGDYDEFFDSRGQKLTIAQAARTDCE